MKYTILLLTLALTGCTQLESLVNAESEANDKLNRDGIDNSKDFICDRRSGKVFREKFPSVEEQKAVAVICGYELRTVEIPLKPEGE